MSIKSRPTNKLWLPDLCALHVVDAQHIAKPSPNSLAISHRRGGNVLVFAFLDLGVFNRITPFRTGDASRDFLALVIRCGRLCLYLTPADQLCVEVCALNHFGAPALS